ncbi:MAG: LysM peptidoglycan-binding domain-containing protein [Anaerolineales bacterium]|nr:LysM peptidoglycan-binding domain-containing protein [Anaerolineales bacterium]
MNIASLLIFAPLGFGIAWLFYLIFRANLATQPLGKIVSYFVGVLIILLVIGVFIDFFPSWALERLENAQQSIQWQQFIDTSSNILEDTFDTNSGSSFVAPTPVVQPTQVPVIQATPVVGGTPAADPNNTTNQDNSMGPVQYTIVTGDTLSSIATKFNTTVDAIMMANGLTSYIIYPGDQLLIPAASGK